MKRSRAPLFLGLALSVALAACEPESSNLGPIVEGQFSATIVGADSTGYTGSGLFHSNLTVKDWPAELPQRFFMYSTGYQDSNGAGMAIVGGDGERPAVGTYDLGWGEDSPHDWSLVYNVRRGDSIVVYGARTGQLEVTRSDAQTVTGRFNLTAVGNLVCDRSVLTMGLDPDEETLPCSIRGTDQAEVVEIKGLFSATTGLLPCVSLPTESVENGSDMIPPVVVCF